MKSLLAFFDFGVFAFENFEGFCGDEAGFFKGFAEEVEDVGLKNEFFKSFDDLTLDLFMKFS